MHLLAPWTCELERQVHQFIDNWLGYHADYGAEITWLPHLLRHVYGDARAQASKRVMHCIGRRRRRRGWTAFAPAMIASIAK